LEEEPNLEIAQMIGLDGGEIDDSVITSNAVENDYNIVPQVNFILHLPSIHTLNT